MRFKQGMILCKAPKVFNLEPSSKPCLIFNHFLISVHEKKLMDKCPPEKAFHFSKCPTHYQGEILLEMVPSRNFLSVLYG